jgi:WD repeat-containing protein 26
VCRRTIDREHHVHSIAWLPGGEAFLSVEESKIVRLVGKILASSSYI